MILVVINIIDKMGGVLQRSREEDLPTNINDQEVRQKIESSWTESNILAFEWTALQCQPGSTLSTKTLNKAIPYLQTIFKQKDLNVLEVFAGNCYASQIIYNGIKDKVLSWICTDAINFPKPVLPDSMRFEQLNSVQAVTKFGNEADILLMISPPPFPSLDKKSLGYGDYYACYDFINQNKEKYIFFIGELGVSDGSVGMYKYLTTHPKLTLICRAMLDSNVDVFGDPGEKELFIFLIK